MTTSDDGGDVPEATRPVALDGVAADAWQAYNAMETTKRRHFALLETIDLRRRNYGIEPSADDTRLLAWLLADHDAQVGRFTAASVALKDGDASAHAALFEYVGRVTRVDEASADEGRRTH